MDMINGTNRTDGSGFFTSGIIILLLVLWFFNKNNETPSGYCQDMSNQCASAIATQTTLNGEIRNQQEFCRITSGQYEQTEKTRDKLDSLRDEYQNNRYLDAKFELSSKDTEIALLKQQLITQQQFNQTNASIAQLGCECLKRPPVYPYVCTPCPANPCNGVV